MTVTAPPRPPRPSDPVDREEVEALVEALIEEARKRAQRRRRRNGAVVTLVALVAAALFAVLGRSAQSQTASPAVSARLNSPAQAVTSRIAFIRQHGGGYSGVLWVMSPDGSGQRELAPAFPGMRWSPDGQKIAFSAWSDVTSDVYVMDADGSGQERLTSDPSSEGGVAWSPDGRKIAFVSRRDGNVGIYVMNADGSEQRTLTSDAWSDAWGLFDLAWSPLGDRIAFMSRRDGNLELYIMNADGSEQRRLTRNTVRDSNPVWSPDGRRIAFESNWQVWVMNADGSGQRRLTRAVVLEVTVKNENRAEGNYSIYVRTDESQGLWYTGLTYRSRAKAEKLAQTIRDRGARNFAPAWSSDGQRIAFERRLGRQQSGRCSGCGNALIFEVHVMNADGSGQQALTRRGAQPGWSPDGRRIAFMTKRDGNAEIYVMNADGSGQQNLTRTRGPQESWLVWSPAQSG